MLALGATAPALDAPLYLDAIARIRLNPDIRSLDKLSDRLVYPPSKQLNTNRNDPSRPVVFAIYTLIWSLRPDSPLAFRLLNLLLHALNALLVYLCCRLVFRLAEPRASDWWPAGVAAAFAVSPINVGTAIYTYALSDVLAMTFSLAALLSFERWRSEAKARWGIATVSALLLGLLTKQSLVVLPGALLLFDVLVLAPAGLDAGPAAGGQAGATRSRSRLGFVARGWRGHLALLPLVIGYLVWRQLYFGQIGDVEGTTHLWNGWDYALVQPGVILRYIACLFVPLGYSIDHTFDRLVSGEMLLHAVAPALILGGLLVGLLRLVRAPSALHAACAFALGWFLLQLVPTSSVMPTVDALVERRAYIPSMGLYLFVALATARLVHDRLHVASRRGAAGLVARIAPVTIGIAMIASFLLLAGWRSYTFRDAIATWTRVAKMYPGSIRATNNLAAAHLENKHYAVALTLYRRATELRPDDISSWFNLGKIYRRRDSGFHQPRLAIAAFRKVLALNPTYALAYYPLARLLQQRGELDEAQTLYDRSIAAGLLPAESLNNLGLIEVRRGDLALAEERFVEALRLAPTYAPARNNLASLREGRFSRPPQTTRTMPRH